MTSRRHTLLACLVLVAHCSSHDPSSPEDSTSDPDAVDLITDDPDEDVDPDLEDARDVPDDPALDLEEEEATGVRADRVLFIGNSYTGVNSLHLIVSDLLIEAGHDGHTRAYTPGGYRLEEHAADADGTNGDTALRDLLVTGEEAALGWDAVVLQQQSQVPGFPRDEPTWIAMVNGATILRDLAMDAGADTVLFMTWGYRDGDELNPTLYPDYPTMQDRISDGYNDLADRISTSGEPVFVAPVGEAYRSIHLEGDGFTGLYALDGSHPSIRGSYLAACVIFSTLTSTSPVGLDSGPTELTGSERLELQQVADAIVLDTSAPERYTR